MAKPVDLQALGDVIDSPQNNNCGLPEVTGMVYRLSWPLLMACSNAAVNG